MGKNPETIDDMEIYDVITSLNNFPFIQTYECCRGHPEVNKTANFAELNVRDKPYVDYFITENLYLKGVELTKTIGAKIRHNVEKISPSTRFGVFLYNLNDNGRDTQINLKEIWNFLYGKEFPYIGPVYYSNVGQYNRHFIKPGVQYYFDTQYFDCMGLIKKDVEKHFDITAVTYVNEARIMGYHKEGVSNEELEEEICNFWNAIRAGIKKFSSFF